MFYVRLCFALLTAAFALSGCSSQPSFVVKDEPWREDEERACLASGMVRETQFITVRSALGGPSVCGALQPFTVSATANGAVQLQPAALLRCQMVPAIEDWTRRVVIPAARYYYGVPVVELKVAGSFSCRPMNNVDGAYLSEHGHANAVDISGFVLADGRVVTVKGGWAGHPADHRFLRAVRLGACDVFTTVLGPGYDANHHDHFHLDLARHGGSGRVCK
jgi:hypothetical protein